MASSQVEFPAAAASPFGCVLRDHNSRGDRRRDCNTNPSPSPKSQSSFQRNLKELVRDHLHSCISLSPRASNHEPDENSDQQCGGFICFGGGGGGNSSRNTTTTTNHHHHRWAAQKAKEMVTTIESLSSKPQAQTQPSSISLSKKKERRDPSSTQSESSSSDFSVSSLVQKWRGFEAVARHNHAAAAATNVVANEPQMSRANSTASTCESTVTMATVDDGGEREEAPVEDEEEVAVEEREERERIRVADIVRKWPGDEQATPTAACLAKLKIGVDSRGDQGETRVFSPHLVSSPRIRGRQAIADLFMSLERERYKEVESLESRHAVTKFPQRGRIQSLLRLRFLRRELTLEEQQRPPIPSKVVGSSQCQTVSTINSLRASADQDSTNQKCASRETPNSSNQDTQSASTSKHISEQANCQHEPNIRSSLTQATKNEQETQSAATSKHPIDQATHQEHLNITSMDNCEDTKSISSCREDLNISSQDSEQWLNTHCEEGNTATELCVREQEVAHQNPLTQVIEVLQEEIPSSEVMWQARGYEEDGVNIETQDLGETDALYNSWEDEEDESFYEEHEASSQHFFETNLDWITDIARPRSYWEDLRQAWYQEVFNTKSQDEEIRQLLERGSVSAVLASDFRDRMDRLVMNSVQRAMHSSAVEDHEEDRSMRTFFEQRLPSFNCSQQGKDESEQPDQEQVQDEQNRRQLLERGSVSAVLSSDFRERMDRLVLNRVQRAMHSSVVEEHEEDRSRRQEHIEDVEQEHNKVEDEQENSELVDDREDESSGMHQQSHDGSDYYDQNSSSSHLQWDHHYHHPDHEGSYDSDHAASTSLQKPSPVPSFDRDIHGSSFKNPSIEMELIYDLRSHMEQLYREMSELRKSITSCMDMQMKMQHSIREEVSAAINRKDQVEWEKKDSNRRKPKKGICCICYEKKVDSLLYRCGHMCTCFTCANELQWSSGKCPICRAQIIDVVRAYPDS